MRTIRVSPYAKCHADQILDREIVQCGFGPGRGPPGFLPARFPSGIHLEHDLRRFLKTPILQIIDGGANHGDTALRFARYFKEATIHAFEPVQTTFDRLEKRSRAQPRVHCLPLALGEQSTQVKIWLNQDSELNSLLNNNDAPLEDVGFQTVDVVSLDHYAETRGLKGIDLLKLDLEGYELPALRGASTLFAKGMIRAVYAECGFLSNDRYKTSFGHLNEIMQTHGFLFSGFYQTYRWGADKQWALFSNGLWLRK